MSATYNVRTWLLKHEDSYGRRFFSVRNVKLYKLKIQAKKLVIHNLVYRLRN